MSARRANFASPIRPGLDRLQHVLTVGVNNNPIEAIKTEAEVKAEVEAEAEVDVSIESLDLGMSDDDFIEEVDQIASMTALDMQLSPEDIAAFREEAKKKGMEYADMAKRKSKELGNELSRMSKEGGKELARLSKTAAKELVSAVKLAWSGARSPAHYLTLTKKELTKRLLIDLKRTFSEKAWKNIVAAVDAERHYVLDSMANLFVAITFNEGNVTVTAFVRDLEGDGTKAEVAVDALSYTVKESLGGKIRISTTTFSSVYSTVEAMIDEAVAAIKDKLNKVV